VFVILKHQRLRLVSKRGIPPPPRRHYTYRPNPGNNETIPTVQLPNI